MTGLKSHPGPKTFLCWKLKTNFVSLPKLREMATRLSEQEKKYILETKSALTSKDEKYVLGRLRELKISGNVTILPYILDLLVTSNSNVIIQEVLNIIRDLKDQKCVPVIVEYIDKNKVGKHVSDIISSCWQSRLDFHAHLNIFADCFLHGNYQTSLEAFTVIEEMIWKSSEEQIQSCKEILVDNVSKVNREKHPLYRELIKVLDEGRSENSETYPDLYDQ